MRNLSNFAVVCILIAAAVTGSCGFGELFSDAGPGDVRFVTTDTLVIRGTSIPFRVELWVDGVPAATPAVQRQIPDSTRIRFNATGDSIIGIQVGVGDVVVWIESSLAPRVDSTLRIRVRP